MSGIFTRTDLGALTTTFTPPSACFVSFFDINIESDSGFIYPEYGQTCSFGATTFDDSCYPPGFENFYKYNALSTYHAVYSPATICPSGFRSACAFTRTDGPIDAPYSAEREILSALTPGEVDVACCLTGYTCAYEDAIMSCDSEAEYGDVITGTVYNEKCEVETTTITAEGTETFVWDYMVPIHIAINTDAESSSPTSATATATATESATASPDSSDSSNQQSGISSTTIIIVVVVVVVVIAIICLVAFIVWRRRRAKRTGAPPANNERYEELPAKKSHASNYNNNNDMSHELLTADSFARTPELPSQQTGFIHEMPGEEVIRSANLSAERLSKQ